MGLSSQLSGQRVYFDTNILIYLFGGFGNLRASLEELRVLLADGAIEAHTSELSLCEVLVKPLMRSDKEEVALYRSLLEDSGAFELLATSRSTYLLAARLRAELGLKTPDAIHVTTAVEAGCSIFLSNDSRIRLPAGLGRVGLGSTS